MNKVKTNNLQALMSTCASLNQGFLFLLELLLGLTLESASGCEASCLVSIRELHSALSTSDGVKVSFSELNSCRLSSTRYVKKTSINHKNGELSNFDYFCTIYSTRRQPYRVIAYLIWCNLNLDTKKNIRTNEIP